MLEAYFHDPDVIEAMAESPADQRTKQPPALFGWTAQLSALKDIQDQMIASRGGRTFVPRPVIPGVKEMWKRKDDKLTSVVGRIVGGTD